MNLIDAHRAAERLTEAYDVPVPESWEEYVQFADKRLVTVEYLAHELGHAALLDLCFGRHLSRRITNALHDLSQTANWCNELDTFAVEMRLFDSWAFPYDRGEILMMAGAQVPWNRPEIEAYWKELSESSACVRATRRIMAAFSRWSGS